MKYVRRHFVRIVIRSVKRDVEWNHHRSRSDFGQRCLDVCGCQGFMHVLRKFWLREGEA